MSAAKARLEDELAKLESLLRLLDEYEHTLNEQTLILLSQKLKVIVPDLRQLSSDPQYKTPECAPLLVTLGQGVKNVIQRTRGITLAQSSPAVGGGGVGGGGGGGSATTNTIGSGNGSATAKSPRLSLAEPKPLRGYLKKRGDKGLVRGYKLRYFEQRGEKIMYFRSESLEDLHQSLGWIDLSKMVSVEKTPELNCFDLVTAGRIYHLMVVPAVAPTSRDSRRQSTLQQGAAEKEDVTALSYWIDGLLRYKEYRKNLLARMNHPSPAASAMSPGSPMSAAWSNMSDASEDEQRRGSMLDSPASPETRSETEAALRRNNTSARRLNFDDDAGVDSDDISSAPSSVLSPNAVVAPPPLPPSSSSLSLSSSLRSSMPAKAAVLVPVVAQENPPETAAVELAALKQALQATKKELADAKYLADIREKEVMALQKDLRARDLALDREVERTQVAEEKLHLRNAQVQRLERDLASVSKELETREVLIGELRAKERQALTSDLARLVASMGASGASGGARQKEVISLLTKELEHEREANDAHQQRVRFMAQQLAEVEKRSKTEIDLRDVAVEYTRVQNVRLKERLAEARLASGVDPQLLAQFETLKREYFHALGVGMKLNLAMQGQLANVDLMALYEQVSDTLPFTQWNKFLSLSLAAELNPSKHEAITAQLNSLLLGGANEKN